MPVSPRLQLPVYNTCFFRQDIPTNGLAHKLMVDAQELLLSWPEVDSPSNPVSEKRNVMELGSPMNQRTRNWTSPPLSSSCPVPLAPQVLAESRVG